MFQFTVKGDVTLKEGDKLKIKTDNKLELYILFADGVLSVSNESKPSAPSSVVLVQKDGRLVFEESEPKIDGSLYSCIEEGLEQYGNRKS